MMTYDQFTRRVVELLELDLVFPVNPFDGLFDEVGLDSFQTMQLIVVIEALAGIDVPPLEIPEMFTVQDTYDYYGSLCALAVT